MVKPNKFSEKSINAVGKWGINFDGEKNCQYYLVRYKVLIFIQKKDFIGK